jgi:hypothetical protein
MNEVDRLAQDIYVQMVIRDDITFANPGARLLAAKRAEGAYTLAHIFLDVRKKIQDAPPE